MSKKKVVDRDDDKMAKGGKVPPKMPPMPKGKGPGLMIMIGVGKPKKK